MQIEKYIKKEIFGSFERAKIPGNLSDYNCQLCIEEYAEGPVYQEIKYFLFTPKTGIKAQPFKIIIDNINKANNLAYLYTINEKNTNANFRFGQRVKYKMQTTVVEPPRKENNIENLPQPDSDGQFVFRDIDENKLMENFIRLQDSGEEDNYSGDSKCVEPSETDKLKIKSQLIEYLYIEQNRFAKFKEIKTYLLIKGYKVSEYQIKQALTDICKNNIYDKRSGFILKDNYFSKEEYERKNPKKKIKEE